jgi:hypothetical protein
LADDLSKKPPDTQIILVEPNKDLNFQLGLSKFKSHDRDKCRNKTFPIIYGANVAIKIINQKADEEFEPHVKTADWDDPQ